MTNDRFWKAVEHRDARFDGRFVYAVRSTGVYCRPSCPSRRPLRKSVLFFAQTAAAESRGFRACKRCGGRPKEGVSRAICRYIDRNLEEPVKLRDLAREFKLSAFHLQRTFKREMGISPRQYAASRRMGLWKSRARQGADVTTALYDAGYGSSSRLYEKASSKLGMTPAAYRKGGAGMKIEYVITKCKLGLLLVGFTHRGVSAVYLGENEKRLEGALHEEYPRAEIRRADGARSGWVKQLLAYLDGQTSKLDLPLDLAATSFQMRVWEELRRIPYGTTRTYAEVAESIDQPTATRAVARACAANPVSLVVPCHRVVRQDGELAGYRWGLVRKQALLAAERSAG